MGKFVLTTCIDRFSANKTIGPFFAEEPITYAQRLILMQLSLITLVQSVLTVLLKPIGETPVVAQILGGLLVGPTGIARDDEFRKTIYPNEGSYLLETLGNFGCMIYLFLIGVKMDVSIVKKSSKEERLIGILSFVIPLVLTLPASFSLKKDPEEEWLHTVALMGSTTSFHVISCFLADLNILNTDLGRLATSASTISGMCSWIMLEIAFAVRQNEGQNFNIWLEFGFSTLFQVTIITVVLRKIVIWIIRQTPQGEPVKEYHLFIIFVMILGTAIMGETFGQHAMFGPMIFGLAVPDGPPVGSALADKLEGFISALLLPVYFFPVGMKINFHRRRSKETMKKVILLFSLGFLGKVTGTVMASLFYKIPLLDAFMLALILSTLGIFDIQTYTSAVTTQIINIDCYGYLVVIALVLAGVISPIVHFFYKPTRPYVVHKKRTIENTKRDVELPILICIYNQESVPTILNILEASNPTRESPVVVYLLHLVELLGRSIPVLVAHKPHEKQFDKATPSDHIINSFKIYEKQNKGVVVVQPFTAMTPVVTAHDDVCKLAAEKRTSFIIIPFHKQWNIDGTAQSSKWRNTNKRVIEKAPCSVGLLIDRGGFNPNMSILSGRSSFSVGVIFLGGADDREAMFYAMRMAKHPHIQLTVHRLVPTSHVVTNVLEKRVDGDVINAYRLENKGNQNSHYKEDVVKDGVEVVSLVSSIQDAYNLVLVGRRHYNYSTLLSAFMEWSEYPELGFFGDMFASSDINGNVKVLVIQQQSLASIHVMPDSSGHAQDSDTDFGQL